MHERIRAPTDDDTYNMHTHVCNMKQQWLQAPRTTAASVQSYGRNASAVVLRRTETRPKLNHTLRVHVTNSLISFGHKVVSAYSIYKLFVGRGSVDPQLSKPLMRPSVSNTDAHELNLQAPQPPTPSPKSQTLNHTHSHKTRKIHLSNSAAAAPSWRAGATRGTPSSLERWGFSFFFLRPFGACTNASPGSGFRV